jgi:glutamate-1-semialdehyde 2,1-aminomutase
MAAVIGRREVMEPASQSFISTTYHTERLGPVAACATIRKMRETGAIEHNNRMVGREGQQAWVSACLASHRAHVA